MDERLGEVLDACGEFCKAWFPNADEPDAVQAFWFAARYPRERKFFKKLCRRFEQPLEKANLLLAEGSETLLRDVDCAALMRLCIFVDQQPRNARALEADTPGAAADLVEAFTPIALELALRVLSVRPSAAELLSLVGASAAQVCFLTLALRHVRRLPEALRAERLLAELAAERPGLEVVVAFQRENAAVVRRLEAEAYVAEATRSGLPEMWASAGEPPGSSPQGGGADACLAPAARDLQQAEATRLLAWTSDAAHWAELTADPLCVELRKVLEAHDLLGEDAHILLSFSAGVDSTAHLLLLLAALRRPLTSAEDFSRERGPRISCLMLAYPNRDEAEVLGERRWAEWVCRSLGVDLHGFVVRLARPHSEDAGRLVEAGSGLSREEYERATKEIRFRMYRCILGLLGDNGDDSLDARNTPRAAVVLGHHLDDTDENRLDHLQKGHLLGDVEGFRQHREVLGVPLLRPLLGHRKAEFLQLLAAHPAPFLRDSTPAWSVRGSTRRVLDGLAWEQRELLLVHLGEFGRLAADVGEELDAAIAAWSAASVRSVRLPRGATGVAMDLDALLALDVQERLQSVAAVVEEIRALWNPAARADQPSAVREVPASDIDDAPFCLFERGFFAAAAGFLSARRPGHYHTSKAAAVNRKAVRHLFENAQSCGKPDFGGGLTQELGYVHIAGPPCRTLVLYDAAAHAGVDFKGMRGAIIEAVRRM